MGKFDFHTQAKYFAYLREQYLQSIAKSSNLQTDIDEQKRLIKALIYTILAIYECLRQMKCPPHILKFFKQERIIAAHFDTTIYANSESDANEKKNFATFLEEYGRKVDEVSAALNQEHSQEILADLLQGDWRESSHRHKVVSSPVDSKQVLARIVELAKDIRVELQNLKNFDKNNSTSIEDRQTLMFSICQSYITLYELGVQHYRPIAASATAQVDEELDDATKESVKIAEIFEDLRVFRNQLSHPYRSIGEANKLFSSNNLKDALMHRTEEGCVIVNQLLSFEKMAPISESPQAPEQADNKLIATYEAAIKYYQLYQQLEKTWLEKQIYKDISFSGIDIFIAPAEQECLQNLKANNGESSSSSSSATKAVPVNKDKLQQEISKCLSINRLNQLVISALNAKTPTINEEKLEQYFTDVSKEPSIKYNVITSMHYALRLALMLQAPLEYYQQLCKVKGFAPPKTIKNCIIDAFYEFLKDMKGKVTYTEADQRYIVSVLNLFSSQILPELGSYLGRSYYIRFMLQIWVFTPEPLPEFTELVIPAVLKLQQAFDAVPALAENMQLDLQACHLEKKKDIYQETLIGGTKYAANIFRLLIEYDASPHHVALAFNHVTFRDEAILGMDNPFTDFLLFIAPLATNNTTRPAIFSHLLTTYKDKINEPNKKGLTLLYYLSLFVVDEFYWWCYEEVLKIAELDLNKLWSPVTIEENAEYFKNKKELSESFKIVDILKASCVSHIIFGKSSLQAYDWDADKGALADVYTPATMASIFSVKKISNWQDVKEQFLNRQQAQRMALFFAAAAEQGASKFLELFNQQVSTSARALKQFLQAYILNVCRKNKRRLSDAEMQEFETGFMDILESILFWQKFTVGNKHFEMKCLINKMEKNRLFFSVKDYEQQVEKEMVKSNQELAAVIKIIHEISVSYDKLNSLSGKLESEADERRKAIYENLIQQLRMQVTESTQQLRAFAQEPAHLLLKYKPVVCASESSFWAPRDMLKKGTPMQGAHAITGKVGKQHYSISVT